MHNKHKQKVMVKDMGQRFILTDDLDERIDAVGSLTFFKGGQEFEIDLGAENMEKYKKLLSDHAELLGFLADNGRPVRRQTPLSAPRGRTKAQLDEIRQWARANGFPDVKDVGRIPDKVIDAYETRSRMPEKVEETTNEVPEGGETGTAGEPTQEATQTPKPVPAAEFSAELPPVVTTNVKNTNKPKAGSNK